MAAEESEALIESNFRRLLAAIEDERDRLRNGVKQLEEQKERTKRVCEEMKAECEKWCFEERQKIAKAWEEVKEVHKQIGVLNPKDEQTIEINCAGTHFQTTKSTLTVVQGSYLNQLFSAEFEGKLQKDKDGRYLLDFHPVCFGLILDWLRNKKQSQTGTVPLPPVPPEQRGNMDILCESLKLGQFIPTNVLQTVHQTSLLVTPNSVESTHDGWQVIVAQYPLRMSRKSYFEAKVTSNADPRGGLAVGVIGHVPTGLEIHSLKQKDGILYNSNNGLINTACCGMADILKQIMFKEGSAIGCEFDPGQHLVRWYFNHQLIGSCAFTADVVDQIQTVYPCFALFSRGQKLSVDFKARPPMSSETAKQGPE